MDGATIEQKLVTHTYDGIDIQPLFTRRDQLKPDNVLGLPGESPFVRGSNTRGTVERGWDLRQEHSPPDLNVANRAILEDLEGGATSIALRFDMAARSGLDPDTSAAAALVARDGVAVYSVQDLNKVFDAVQLPLIGVALDAGAAFMPAAAMLVALWRKRGLKLDQVRGAFNADPMAVLAREGTLPVSATVALQFVGDLAAWTSKNYPHVTAVGVDTSPYHHTGASAAQDIGFAIATGVEYLRAMTANDLGIDAAARQIVFNIRVGTHHFQAIAKLRAARWLWSRVIEAAGGSPVAGGMHINASISQRVLTQRDSYVNLLRNTVAVFAAGIAGADSITSVPFDTMFGPSNAFSRRIARNTALILQEEAHLHRVIDPTGGSWFLDRLTQQIADQGWKVFQQVERNGGMLQALISGWVAAQIDAVYAARSKDFASGNKSVVGVNKFADPDEKPLIPSQLDFDSLRKTAAARLAKSRHKNASLESLRNATTTNRMSAAIETAMNDATIGQIAHALGFHNESVEIPPLKLRRLAEPFEQQFISQASTPPAQ